LEGDHGLCGEGIMSNRKHISWKTRCASAVLDAQLVRERFGLYPQRWYDDAKKMTEDQFLSLFQWDHNILHATEDESRDKFWNLTPLLIQEHRTKTKTDAKVVAKGRRIRAKLRDAAGAGNGLARLRKAPLRTDPDKESGVNFRRQSIPPLSGSHKLTPAERFSQQWADYVRSTKPKRKIRSRGFDKTRRRTMSGKVVKRER
jgi:hypothetical protein